MGGIEAGSLAPTSSAILRAGPAASATYTRLESVGSEMTARILLGTRMGEPLVFLDLRALRFSSAIESLGERCYLACS